MALLLISCIGHGQTPGKTQYKRLLLNDTTLNVKGILSIEKQVDSAGKVVEWHFIEKDRKAISKAKKAMKVDNRSPAAPICYRARKFSVSAATGEIKALGVVLIPKFSSSRCSGRAMM